MRLVWLLMETANEVLELLGDAQEASSRTLVLELDDSPHGDFLEGLVAVLFIGLAIGAALFAGGAYAFFSKSDVVVTRAVAHELHARACISQAAIYERMPKPACAAGTYDVPANALSYPLAR